MLPTHSGSFRLFRFAGIQVYLHWTWFLAAAYFLMPSGAGSSNFAWNLAAYLTLFAIVLVHEFGHAFAARQVGGESREIVLWPFGGIAFAKVPPRPGAELWAIAAGPLVNVVLFPILWWIVELAHNAGLHRSNPALMGYLATVFWINKQLLIFNLLPIYPLDGGQLVRALLWFKLGRARSLHIAALIGFVGVAALVVRAFNQQSLFSGMIAAFLGMECWRGYQQAQAMKRLSQLPRHQGVACPTCNERPPGGPLWACPSCGNRFDPFSTRAACPHCTTLLPAIPCAHCGSAHPIERWDTSPPRRAGEPPVIEV